MYNRKHSPAQGRGASISHSPQPARAPCVPQHKGLFVSGGTCVCVPCSIPNSPVVPEPVPSSEWLWQLLSPCAASPARLKGAPRKGKICFASAQDGSSRLPRHSLLWGPPQTDPPAPPSPVSQPGKEQDRSQAAASPAGQFTCGAAHGRQAHAGPGSTTWEGGPASPAHPCPSIPPAAAGHTRVQAPVPGEPLSAGRAR